MATCDDREVPAVDHPVFDHEGPWTEAAYLALSTDAVPCGGRVELVEGALLVGPGPARHRAQVVGRVRDAVEAALPGGLRVIGPVPLRLGPDCVLVPDLVVTRAAPADGAVDSAAEAAPDGRAAGSSRVLDAADALMVLEVVGREHGVTDRSFKPQLYARSRIPYSLLVDHDGPFAAANMIISGRYHEYAHAAGEDVFRIEEPFALELDLTAATRAEQEAPAAH